MNSASSGPVYQAEVGETTAQPRLTGTDRGENAVDSVVRSDLVPQPPGAAPASLVFGSGLPGQHLVENINRTTIHLTLHQPTTRNDQRGCPLAPREAIPTESLDEDEVNPVAADAVANQRPILAWACTPKLKAA